MNYPTITPLKSLSRAKSGIPAFAGMTMWVVAALLLLLAAPATAQTFPKLTGQVVDEAELLQPAQEEALTA